MGQAVITISSLLEKDKEQVTAVLLEGYSQYRESYGEEDWLEYSNTIIKSLDNPNIEKTYVAKVDDKIVGSVQIFLSAQLAYDWEEQIIINAPIIRLLVVHPEARGHGIAQKLIEECLHFSKKQHAKQLFLHTTDLMENAIQLYEKLGFIRQPSKDRNKHNRLVKCYAIDVQTYKF